MRGCGIAISLLRLISAFELDLSRCGDGFDPDDFRTTIGADDSSFHDATDPALTTAPVARG